MISEKSNNLFFENQSEKESPVVRYKMIRHAERTTSGELTEDGINDARIKGQNLKDSAEVVKGYSSMEKSDRAYKTVEIISGATDIVSPITEDNYKTRRRSGLFYDLSGPLMSRIDKYSKLINETVIKDYPDFDPKSSDPKWGKIRKEYQPIGIKGIIVDNDLRHILAMGTAHQLYEMIRIGSRYTAYRDKKSTEDQSQIIKKDVVLMEGTHGGFLESLLKKALVRVDSEGREKLGFSAYIDEQGNPELESSLGGILKPGESFEIVQKINQKAEGRLPIFFEDKNRFPGEKCFIDIDKIKILSEQFNVYYDKFKEWQKNNSLDKELLICLDKLKDDFATAYEENKK